MPEVHVLGGMSFDSNIFLVDDDDPVLIDTGTRFHLTKNLEDIGEIMPHSRIGRIVLTHRHYDHTGGASGIAERTGAEVLIHPLDSNTMRVGDSVSSGARNFGDDLERVDVSLIEEREIIKTGELEFTVIHTPGHTVGGVCLFDVNHGILISGDTVFSQGGIGRWDLPTGSFEQLVASITLLSKLDVKSLYPGHMASVEKDGSSHVKAALDNLLNYSKEELLMSRVKAMIEHGDEVVKTIDARKRVSEVKTRFDIDK